MVPACTDPHKGSALLQRGSAAVSDCQWAILSSSAIICRCSTPLVMRCKMLRGEGSPLPACVAAPLRLSLLFLVDEHESVLGYRQCVACQRAGTG
jgi:hypothetical protein